MLEQSTWEKLIFGRLGLILGLASWFFGSWYL
jgi:hypothetical protein